MTATLEQRLDAFRRLDDAKLTFARRDWFPGTSGNLSIKIQDRPLQFAVTASGKDKTKLSPEDYLVVDRDSRPVDATSLKPSAETLIHAVVHQKFPQAGACFHVHTVWNNLISELYFGQRAFSIQGQELIKGLGIWEENARITVPIVENFADIPTLAAAIEKSSPRKFRACSSATTAFTHGAATTLKRSATWKHLNFCSSTTPAGCNCAKPSCPLQPINQGGKQDGTNSFPRH